MKRVNEVLHQFSDPNPSLIDCKPEKGNALKRTSRIYVRTKMCRGALSWGTSYESKRVTSRNSILK
jgi:hypothetical protein